jgi:hypothetical protein
VAEQEKDSAARVKDEEERFQQEQVEATKRLEQDGSDENKRLADDRSAVEAAAKEEAKATSEASGSTSESISGSAEEDAFIAMRTQRMTPLLGLAMGMVTLSLVGRFRTREIRQQPLLG